MPPKLPPLKIDFRKSKLKGIKGRILVGYKSETWIEVFYEPVPDAEPDTEGNIPMALYCHSEGPAQAREPTEGAVEWLPQFALKSFPGTSKEKQFFQMQILSDLYEYLDESDADQVQQIEERLNLRRVRDMRWLSIFPDAKRWKEADLRTRRSTKQKRMKDLTNLLGDGIDPAEFHVPSSDDESEHDSAYGEDLFVNSRTRSKATSDIGKPPPLPTPNAPNKRRSTTQGSGRASKRGKANAKGGRNKKNDDNDVPDEYYGSGGLQDPGLSPLDCGRSSSVVTRRDYDMYSPAPAHRPNAGRGGASSVGIHRFPVQPTVEDEDRTAGNGSWRDDMQDGNVSPEEALAQAMRNSMAPDTRPDDGQNGGPTEDDGTGQARHDSAQTEN